MEHEFVVPDFYKELTQVMDELKICVSKIGIPSKSITLQKSEVLELRVAAENVVIMVDSLKEMEKESKEKYKIVQQLRHNERMKIIELEKELRELKQQLTAAQAKILEKEKLPTGTISFNQ